MYCWIQRLHPATADHSDFSVFHLTTCHLSRIPTFKDLIAEPTEFEMAKGPLEKKTLAYNVLLDTAAASCHS
uniref:Uncharacterized protein n=1 Tax=Arundo donax TaxID=35708 RepID=A0A0A9GXN7_ARUDO